MSKSTQSKATTKEEVSEAVIKEFKKIPGQKDYLPEDWHGLEYLMNQLNHLASAFGFERCEPALFELMEITQNFHKDKGEPLRVSSGNGIDVALRTNGLAGMLRAYIESEVYEKEDLTRWYYLSPVFRRHKNPHQVISDLEYGFEVVGDDGAIFDAQVLALAWKLYSMLGDDAVILEIGSRGCENCWPEYQEILTRTFSDAKFSLCKECALSVEDNPEKVLSCEKDDCQSIAADAPAFIDHLDEDCSSHLTFVLESLDELKVPYVLVTTSNGEEHSKRTVFRFKFNHPQDSFTLSHGSRHDSLFKHFGHEPKPALGLVGDLGKFLRAWHLSGGGKEKKNRKADVALIPLGELGAKKSLSLFSFLWDEEFSVINVFGENSLKDRLQKVADFNIPVALIVGQKEALDDTVILRDVKSGMQETFPGDRILNEVQKRLD